MGDSLTVGEITIPPGFEGGKCWQVTADGSGAPSWIDPGWKTVHEGHIALAVPKGASDATPYYTTTARVSDWIFTTVNQQQFGVLTNEQVTGATTITNITTNSGDSGNGGTDTSDLQLIAIPYELLRTDPIGKPAAELAGNGGTEPYDFVLLYDDGGNFKLVGTQIQKNKGTVPTGNRRCTVRLTDAVPTSIVNDVYIPVGHELVTEQPTEA